MVRCIDPDECILVQELQDMIDEQRKIIKGWEDASLRANEILNNKIREIQELKRKIKEC